MAKNNEKTASKAVESTEENILDQIKEGNKMTEKVLENAKSEIEKEKDEKKKNILKTAILRADYTNKRELLELRKRRAEEKATKEALASSKTLLDDLCAGKITPVEYDDALKETAKNKKKAFDKAEEDHSKACRELRNGFSGYYSSSWEWNYHMYC